MKNILIIFSFFPYINFGIRQEVVPLFAILFIFYYFKYILQKQFFIKILLLLFVSLLFLYNIIIQSDSKNFIYLAYFIALLLLVSIIYIPQTLPLKIMEVINVVWTISILLSNINIVSHWSLLNGILFSRVYSCDYPLTCARGGSGFAPEPAYAAIVIFFIGIYYLYELYENGKYHKNKLLRIKINLLLVVLNLFLLKTIISGFFLLILLFLYFLFSAKRSFFYIIILIVVLSFLYQGTNKNERIYAFINHVIKYGTQLNDLFFLTIKYGSTRELGTYCGYKNSMSLLPSFLYQEKEFQKCQEEIFFDYKGKDLESGWKPYSPISFIFLYFGILVGIIFLYLLLYPLNKVNNIKVKLLVIFIAFIILFRMTVMFPIPYFILMHIYNKEKRKYLK